LDKWSESGEIWKEVNRLMTEGIDINKGLIKGSELETILRN
jgi:biotin operon repressor